MAMIDYNDISEKAAKTSKASEFERLYGLLLLGVFLLIFFNSGFFNIRHVIVKGNHSVTDEEVLLITRIKENQTLFQTSGEQIRANLLKDTRISTAQVHVQFPNTIRINIQERKPFLLVYYLKNRVAASEDGVVLAAANPENIKLPVVTGIHCTNLVTGTAIKTAEFETARLIILTLGGRIRQALSEIDLQNYQLLLDFPGTDRTIRVELGNSGKLEEKLTNLQAILTQTDLNNLEKIDLRTAESPTIISPTGGSKGINPITSPSGKNP